jgi:hypothetical protein
MANFFIRKAFVSITAPIRGNFKAFARLSSVGADFDLF